MVLHNLSAIKRIKALTKDYKEVNNYTYFMKGVIMAGRGVTQG